MSLIYSIEYIRVKVYYGGNCGLKEFEETPTAFYVQSIKRKPVSTREVLAMGKLIRIQARMVSSTR
jgi:hypothetical protein